MSGGAVYFVWEFLSDFGRLFLAICNGIPVGNDGGADALSMTCHTA